MQSTSSRYPLVRYDSDSFAPRSVDSDAHRSEQHDPDDRIFGLPSSPSFEYSQKVWWESLLREYSPTRDQS